MTELGLRTIPGYTVHEILESDLVSVTYLAERQADGYPVFLHVVSDEFDDARSAAAFLEAHERASQVGHPVLPTIWDVGQASGVLYSVTDAVESRSLAATLRTAGRLDAIEALAVCGELGDTLDILHAADLIHGAINPHTVWINDRSRAPSAPRVTLRGFGVSPLRSPRASAERSGPPPDDLLYVAPEQLRQEEITGRADQYALACMAVHCLSGAPPFERATINALLGAHLFAAPMLADGAWEELPGSIIHAVQRALEKDPADRFSLCGAFATAIGAEKERSWTWMVREALGLSDGDAGPREVPVGGDATTELTVVDGDLSISTDAAGRVDRDHDDAAERRPTLHDGHADERDASRRQVSDRTRPTAWFDDVDDVDDAGDVERDDGTSGRGRDSSDHAEDGVEDRGALDHDATMRSLADADWLPGNSGEPGTAQHRDRRPRPDPRARRAHRSARVDTPIGRRAVGAQGELGERLRDPAVLRWLAVAVVTLLMVVTIVVLAVRTPSDAPTQATAAPQQQSQRAPPEPTVAAAWEAVVSTRRVTSMLATSDMLISGSQTGISALDPATGDAYWQTPLAETVTEVAALDGSVIARSASALHVLDERTGDPQWDTEADAATPTAMAVGGGTVYEVTSNGGNVRVRALAVGSGEQRWALDDLTAAGGGTWAVYDASARGGKVLYVLTGSRLHAVDTAQGAVRWRRMLDGPRPASLTAAAGAILVIDEQGRICRYGVRDGGKTWSECPTLSTGPGLSAALRTRNGQVIVRSADEVAGLDFTSGTSQWRVTDDIGFQRPFAANATTVFVADNDGDVEAIDIQRGVERWRSDSFGEITAMAADGTAVYVATGQGQVTRLEAAAGVASAN